MNKIVIFATCHGNVINRLLRLSPNLIKEYAVESMLNFSSPGVESDPMIHYDEICESNYFLYQSNKHLTIEFLNEIGKYTKVIKIPYVTSSIYWPSMVWPVNGPRLLTSEKYPFGIIPFRCSLLDSLISNCDSDDEIVQRYCELDISTINDLDSHYDAQIQRLRNMDTDNPDIKIANFVDENIKTMHLFYLFNHPSIDLFRVIVEQLFNLMNIRNDLPDNIPDMFFYHQLPIHPSVAAYYELNFVKNGMRWSVGPHKVCFADYVRLYIKGYREQTTSVCDS